MVVARSEDAERFLNSDLVRNFFTETEQVLLQRWQNSAAEDIQGRERIYSSIQLLTAFKSYLEVAIDDGKMAANLIDRMLTGQNDQA